MPQKLKSFEEKKSSHGTYLSFYEKILKSGKTIPIVKRMNLAQFNKTFMPLGARRIKKNVNLAGKKRLLTQIQRDIDKVSTLYVQKQQIINVEYKQFIYNNARKLFNVKKEEITDLNELNFEDIEEKESYGVVRITDKKNDKEYYIKYNSEKDLRKKLKNLEKKYEIENWTSKYLGTYSYKSFILKQYKEKLNKLGVKS